MTNLTWVQFKTLVNRFSFSTQSFQYDWGYSITAINNYGELVYICNLKNYDESGKNDFEQNYLANSNNVVIS